MKTRTITIFDEQDRWIEVNDISLSRFVQKRIEEKINHVNDVKDISSYNYLETGIEEHVMKILMSMKEDLGNESISEVIETLIENNIND